MRIQNVLHQTHAFTLQQIIIESAERNIEEKENMCACMNERNFTEII